MVEAAEKVSSGNVVCIEKVPHLTYDIPSSVRLMETSKDNIEGYEEFYGFLTGVLAGNFDITDMFIDSTLRIGGRDYDKLGKFLNKLNTAVGDGRSISFSRFLLTKRSFRSPFRHLLAEEMTSG